MTKPRDLQHDIKTFKVVPLRRVLDELRVAGRICESAIPHVLGCWGEYPVVNRRNLRRAIRDRGTMHFRSFCHVWLGWGSDMSFYLRGLDASVPWMYRRRVENIYIDAVMAYIEEMRKP